MVDRSGQPDVTQNVIEAHSNFSEDTRIEHTHDRSGKPDERNNSKAQIRTLLEEQRQTIIAEYRKKKSVITNSKQLTQKKSAESYKDNYGDRNWNFVKLVNKVLKKWKNYGKSRVLPSTRSRDENSSRIRTLFCQPEYKELQNEVNCMNDSKDFQDAQSVRSGNSHVTSRPVSFPPHPIPEGMLRHSFVCAEPQRMAAKHLGHT